MKTKKVTADQIQDIQTIFMNHRTNISDVLLGIKEAKTYLDSNIEKSGLYEFAVKTMEFRTNQNFPEENMLARQIYSELDSQLIGNILTESIDSIES